MSWTAAERDILWSFHTPADIQRYVDALEYPEGGGAASPRKVMQTARAQCYSGAIFAAAALRELGHRPRLMWIDAVEDDGHCLAVYEHNGLWGSVAKSNFTTLRSREPIYDYVSLGLSYFDGFYNILGKRTMRAFTVPIELEAFEPLEWRFDPGEMLYVDAAIDAAPRVWKLPPGAKVEPVSDALRKAGLFGANPDGLWRPS